MVHVYKLLLIKIFDMLGTLWTIILIIIAIIVIVLLLQFLVGIFAIAPVGMEFIKSGTAVNIILPVGTVS
jgi:hypothetical protein